MKTGNKDASKNEKHSQMVIAFNNDYHEGSATKMDT